MEYTYFQNICSHNLRGIPYIMNIIPKSSNLFSGREKELHKIQFLLKKANFCYIEGITGIGKTSIMLKWANILDEKTEYKNKILWIQCLEGWTIDTILTQTDEWLIEMGEKSIQTHLKEKSLKNEEKSLYIINNLNKNKYVIFIDDFQHINQKSARIFIDMVDKYLKNSNIYIISNKSLRISPPENIDTCRIRIKEMETKDSLLLLKKFFTYHHFKKIPENQYLFKIAEKSKGNPYILKNLAGLIISKVFTCEDIIEEKYAKKDIEKFIFENITNNLLSDEKRVLEILSASRIALSTKSTEEISGIEHSNKTISLLEDKMLIEKNENCRYLIHPILKEYIWNDLSEDNKKHIHDCLGDYFEKKDDFFRECFYHRINSENPEKAREILGKFIKKLYSHGYYEEIMDNLNILEKYIPLTEYMEIIKANILSINGKWKDSIIILERIKNSITDENILVEAYLSLGRIYMHLNIHNFSKAIYFYEESLKILRKYNDMEKITKTITCLANAYGMSGEFEKVIKLAQESFIIAKKENNKAAMAYALKLKGKIYLEEKNFEKALNIFEKYLELANDIGYFNLIASAIFNKGNAFLGLNNYDEARKCFETCLSFGKERGDNVIIGYSYGGLGSLFYETGNQEKASEYFKHSIEYYKSAGDKTNVTVNEYHMAHIWEEQKDALKAMELYSQVIKRARELSFKELEIKAEIKRLKNILKIGESYISLENILKLKNKIPKILIKEKIEINLILSEIYHRQNKSKEKETALNKALLLAEEANNIYGIAKTCHMMLKMSNKNKEEQFLLKKRVEENFKKLMGSQKRELEYLFNMNETIEKKYLVKTQKKEFTGSLSDVMELRKNQKKFELFIDLPEKYAFEKNKGEIDIFKKVKLLSLLLFFMYSNKDFSSEEIYVEIWKMDYKEDISDGEVRKYISRLRKLIEPDGKTFKYILLREHSLREKGKYYFNNKTNFCIIDEIKGNRD